MKLNIGCGMWGTTGNPWPDPTAYNSDFGAPLPGWVNVDYHLPHGILPEHNFVQHDLNVIPWPFESNSFDEVRAYHILEHLVDLLSVMREVHRVALPDAKVDIVVPYAGTVGDVGNMAHRSHFNHRTFTYLCEGVETNDLDFGKKLFRMVRQFLREQTFEVFGGIDWRYTSF